MSDDRTDDLPIPMPDEPTGRALATLSADNRGVLAIIPRTIEEAQRIASGLIKSGIVPDSFRAGGRRDNPINEPLVLMGVLKSMEVGLPPITGISWLYPINNRFSIYGAGATALVQSKGVVANHKATRVGPGFDPSLELADWPDEFGWDVRFWRKGQTDPYESTFTVRDARRAGLWLNVRKDPWIKYPNRMLFNRARAFVLNDGFSDALMGLSITEEMLDILPDVEDGGDLKPAGPPAYLSDEPVTETPAALADDSNRVDDPLVSTRDMQATGPITGLTPAETIERQQARDLGTEADRQGEF